MGTFRKKTPAITALTFGQFNALEKKHNPENGVFSYKGCQVKRENEDHFVVTTDSGAHHFQRNHVLVTDETENTFLMDAKDFKAAYEAVTV